MSLVFPEVATHNHFALERAGRVVKQTALVINLTGGSREDDCLELAAILNSSTACFWLKQVCFPKGGDQVGSEGARIRKTWWDERYSFDTAKVSAFPVVNRANSLTARLLDGLALEVASLLNDLIGGSEPLNTSTLAEAERRYTSLRNRMIAAQERLDWEVYRLYGLVDGDLTTGDAPEPPLQLGERAFEIALSRRLEAGEDDSSWFVRHGSTPITELPANWHDGYKRLVEKRIGLIGTDLNLGLIERPEYKRRWLSKPWDEHVTGALRTWLLDRLEAERYWPGPAALTTTARLSAEARTDAQFVDVARLYVGREDVDIASLVAELATAEAVPYLAALRYSDSGMRKYARWLETWKLQRREDAGEDVGGIPVPPKYAKTDFQGASWDHRGKLDVPKERFISYPGAQRATDPSLVIGWAGWDELARARALATWYVQAKRDGRDIQHLKPLLAGLAELVPWLTQWYDEPNVDTALDRPGSQIAALLDSELRVQHVTMDEVLAWRPEPARRGRARR